MFTNINILFYFSIVNTFKAVGLIYLYRYNKKYIINTVASRLIWTSDRVPIPMYVYKVETPLNVDALFGLCERFVLFVLLFLMFIYLLVHTAYISLYHYLFQ